MEIKKGERYECIKDVIMSDGQTEFIKGNIYISERDNFITNEGGNKYHGMGDSLSTWKNEHFKVYEYISVNNINPKHYSFNIKGTPCDLFDIGNAMDLNKEQFTALRYFRKKENQIEDTKKAIKCLERLVERLEAEKND